VEIQDHQETLDQLEDQENAERLDVTDHQEPQDQTETVDNKVYQEALESQEPQDQKDNKVIVERSVNED